MTGGDPLYFVGVSILDPESALDLPVAPAFEVRDDDTNDLVRNASQGMTRREYAAIKLRVPLSGNAELDSMIRVSRRADLASQALVAMLGCSDTSGTADAFAQSAVRAVDALFAALGPNSKE